MGYTTSTVHGIEVPDSSEANNVPEDIGKVVTALESGSLVKRLTQAQIDALTSAQKPNGLVVFNTTTGYLQQSNGTSFRDVSSRAVTDFSVVGAGSTGANAYIVPSVAARPSNLYFGIGSLGSSSYRWLIRRTAATETGGSTGTGGSEFEIQRFDNSGTLLGTPVTIRRSDGRVTLERSTVAGDDAKTVATKDYVDAIGVWQDWTPTLSGASGTASGRYTRIGNTIHWQVSLTITGGSGSIYFTTPVNIKNTSSVGHIGNWGIKRSESLSSSSVLDYGPVQPSQVGWDKAELRPISQDGTTAYTSPLTVSQTGNVTIHASGTYEAD